MTKIHLITGGCGFIGRNIAQRLLNTTDDHLIIVDDLSNGIHPRYWLGHPDNGGSLNPTRQERVVFIKSDIRQFLRELTTQPDLPASLTNISGGRIHDVYHFAAIVGGRKKIDQHPMEVALNLAMDAEFFNWACSYKPKRILYPSSSAAYPVDLQLKRHNRLLKEDDINFRNFRLPDNTYGWAKLTGEYLARVAVKEYGLYVTCIRPFSGYGEDQDLCYPIPALAKRAALRENPFVVWGSGLQERDFVHISDVLDCIELAMGKISNGTAVNIGSGRLSNFIDVINILTSFAGYSPEIQTLADKPVGVFSRGGEMTNARDLLDWKPKVSLEKGLRKVFDRISKTEVAIRNPLHHL